MRIRERLLYESTLKEMKKKNGVGKSVASEGSISREPETSVCAVGFQIVGSGSGSFLVGFLFLHHSKNSVVNLNVSLQINHESPKS